MLTPMSDFTTSLSIKRYYEKMLPPSRFPRLSGDPPLPLTLGQARFVCFLHLPKTEADSDSDSVILALGVSASQFCCGEGGTSRVGRCAGAERAERRGNVLSYSSS